MTLGVALAVGAGACRGADSTPPREPVTIEIVSGNAQPGVAGTPLPVAPTVRVLDAADAPFAGAQVHFTIVEGGGATTDTTLTTDATGRTSTTWFLGPDATVAQRLSARLIGVAGPEGLAEFSAQPTRPSNAVTYFGRNEYIEYRPGALPIIISAPHGGTLVPSEIPDRTSGTTVRDTNTEEMARVIADVFEERTGDRPHLVICRLRRTKLDANREIVEAAQGNDHAERAWYEFQTFIETARAAAAVEHGAGLYIDLHGHGHDIQRVEIGYLLTASDLALADAGLDQAAFVAKSSIRALAQASADPFSAIVRGPRSFGALLADAGFRAIPSPADPSPGSEPYFTGGYNTARHGSRNGGAISGMQLELNYAGVRDSATSRRAFAEALVDALITYADERLGLPMVAAQP